MRSIFLCIIFGTMFFIGTLMVACFRGPVQVVQYQDDPPVTVAPVGTVHLSASTAVMNPRVIDPEKVGPLPPKPQPSGGFDFVSALLGVATIAIPGIGIVGTLWSRLRSSIQVGTELVQSVQTVRETCPIWKEQITSVLSQKHSNKTKDFVAKVKKKNKNS